MRANPAVVLKFDKICFQICIGQIKIPLKQWHETKCR